MLLKQCEEKNAVAALKREATAHEEAVRLAAQAEAVDRVQAQRAQGGANVPAAEDPDRHALKRESKVGPSAMKKAAILVQSTAKVGGGGGSNGSSTSPVHAKLKHSHFR